MARANLTRVARAVVAGLAVAVVSSCGGEDEVQRPFDQSKLVSRLPDRVVEAVPANSPERAVLEWFQATQTRTASDAFQMYTPEAQRDLGAKRHAQLVIRHLGLSLQRVSAKVADVDRRGGDRATVVLRLTRRNVVGSDLIGHTAEYVAFPLRRNGGKWRLSDASYVLVEGTHLKRQSETAERLRFRRQADSAR
jgi:hypothetical protein